jgi:hypothetical protein
MSLVDRCIRSGPHVDPASLFSQGVEATLDLETGARIFGDGRPLAEALAGEHNRITVYPHPLDPFWPGLSWLREGVEFLKRQNEHGIITYVHCAHGVDRTGLQIGAYRVLENGWDWKRAASECIANGMHWIYYPWLIQLWRLDR